MTQFVRELLASQQRGWTRAELETALRRQPRFWRQFERNSKAFPEMIRRLLVRGEIETKEGALFASERTRLAALIHTERFELIRDRE